jgi:membrane protease YdiL (CAAX protease family)
MVLNILGVGVERSMYGVDYERSHWYWVSIFSLAPVLVALLVFRPNILLLSRWTLKARYIVIAVVPILLIQSVTLYTVKDGGSYLMRPSPGPIFCILIAGPVLEEVLFRGFILRSLVGRMNVVAAVLIVSVLMSFSHAVFWQALPRQIILSTVYIVCDYSLTASILSHIVLNLIPFLPLSDLLHRGHQTW